MEPRFKQEIQQMMYIAGETQEVSTQTVKLMEELIQDQIVHMLKTANDLANRRGSRIFSNNDIIFQLRHDTARIERLRTFLAWKAIRKTVRDSDDKEGFIEESEMEASANPAEDAAASKTKFPTISLPWDVSSFFSEQVPDMGQDDIMAATSSEAVLDRLRRNDEKTRHMTAAEYATWSEYRHASMTYRKAKRFREWCGLGVIAENRLNDDVLDILGFLASEMVQNLTEEALKVQKQELARAEGRPGSERAEDCYCGLFAEPEGLRKPVDSRHLRMAFQRLQGRPKRHRALLNGARLPWSSGRTLL
ncbi:spt3 [Colletotrichum truncatum]|uniref:Spt3 n=1 Tax=Colletotrichum truncatum TaxID=5467 RepID=A0ACC3YQK3_COLTU